jgi:hypothetical protein
MAENKRNFLSPLGAGLFLWAVVAGVILSSRGMPMWVDGSPGPRFMPLVLVITLGVLTILYWVEAFAVTKAAAGGFPPAAHMVRPACYVGICILLILLWERIGAVPTVFLISVLELRGLERFPWKKSMVIAAGLSVFTWVLFALVLGINLPLGIFKFMRF